MGALLASGCYSQVPLAVNHPLTTQPKIKASHHWDVMADDVAVQTMASLAKHPDLDGETLYVAPAKERTVFGDAFRTFLITRLVNRGARVSKEPEGAIRLCYETQLVRHNSSRYAHVPGTMTTLAAGVWVVRDLVSSTASTVGPVAIGAAGLADYGLGHYSGGPTNVELIVTSSIACDDLYLSRKTDVYYLENADLELFVPETDKIAWGLAEPPPPPATPPPPPMPQKNWRVTGE
jgi:hypothetical protein